MVTKLAELGWLFNKTNYLLELDPIGKININFMIKKLGLVRQSLSNAVKQEMDEYYRLMAIL